MKARPGTLANDAKLDASKLELLQKNVDKLCQGVTVTSDGPKIYNRLHLKRSNLPTLRLLNGFSTIPVTTM